MTARPSPITIGDEVVSLARRYRAEAVASLVTVLRDENSPASARAQASSTLLSYSDGKPGQARQITVDDISTLDDAACERLYRALMNRIEARRPGFFKAMMRDIVDQMLALQATQAALPKPNRFRRGPLAGRGPEVPRWPPAPPAKAISVEMSPKVEEAAYAHAPAPPSHDRRANALSSDASENVVPIKPLAPFGLKFGLAEDPPADSTPGKGNGSIHPHVVYRSTLKDPLAFDTAFFNGRTTKPV